MGFEKFDNITDLGEKALGTPALALLTDNTTLVLAWTEYNSPHLISLKVCSDVFTLPLRFGPKKILVATSAAGPALSAGLNLGIHLAWRGAAYDCQLYFASCLYDPNSKSFYVPSRRIFGELGIFGRGLNEWSYYGPSLSADLSPHPSSDEKVFIAWTGTDRLALVNANLSHDGGQTFSLSNKVVLSEDSVASPGIAFVPATLLNSLVYIFWTGTDKNRSISVVHGNGMTMRPKEILNESSALGPCAGTGTLSDEVLLSWTGGDADHHINSFLSYPGGKSFSGAGKKVIFDQSSIAAPSICSLPWSRYAMAWIDRDSRIRVGVKNIY